MGDRARSCRARCRARVLIYVVAVGCSALDGWLKELGVARTTSRAEEMSRRRRVSYAGKGAHRDGPRQGSFVGRAIGQNAVHRSRTDRPRGIRSVCAPRRARFRAPFDNPCATIAPSSARLGPCPRPLNPLDSDTGRAGPAMHDLAATCKWCEVCRSHRRKSRPSGGLKVSATGTAAVHRRTK